MRNKIYLLLGILPVVSAQINKTTLSATGNTYIAKNTPDVNYNYSGSLQVQNHGSQASRIYTKWDLSGLGSVVVNNALLCLYQTTDGATYNTSIYEVYNSSLWSAGTITWNNQICGVLFNESSKCNLTKISYLDTTGNNNYKCWNVTNGIRSVIAKNKTYASFIIKTPEDKSNGLDGFDSSRTANPTKPYLNITYEYVCEEDWVQYNTSCGFFCGNWDNYQILYTDNNDCGTSDDLPANNGTCVSCDYCCPCWYCAEYNESCGIGGGQSEFITCSNVSSLNHGICCNITGLPSDCNYTGNYTEFNKLCGNIEVVLVLPSYPYVDYNTSYSMQLYLYQNNVSKNLTDFKMEIYDPEGNLSEFNWTWDDTDQRFEETLIFLQEGNYPFVISAYYPYDAIRNITGVFIVKEPYYVTFKLWEVKDLDLDPYENDFGYLILEFKENRYYDNILENFIAPLFFKTTFVTPVFHAPYIDGEATIKLWEDGEDYEYALRFIDGKITFNGTYAPPTILKSYGKNMYLGLYTFNGTDESYDIYVNEKDIDQYRWLLNWGFIISLIAVISVSVALFFVIPEIPQLSFMFGIGFSFLLVVIRVVLFIWKGW